MERAASQKLSPGSISRRNRCPTAVSGVTASYESCVGLRAVLFYFILNKVMWAESMSALLTLYTQRWAQHLAQSRLQDTTVTSREIRTSFRYL